MSRSGIATAASRRVVRAHHRKKRGEIGFLAARAHRRGSSQLLPPASSVPAIVVNACFVSCIADRLPCGARRYRGCWPKRIGEGAGRRPISCDDPPLGTHGLFENDMRRTGPHASASANRHARRSPRRAAPARAPGPMSGTVPTGSAAATSIPASRSVRPASCSDRFIRADEHRDISVRAEHSQPQARPARGLQDKSLPDCGSS